MPLSAGRASDDGNETARFAGSPDAAVRGAKRAVAARTGISIGSVLRVSPNEMFPSAQTISTILRGAIDGTKLVSIGIARISQIHLSQGAITPTWRVFNRPAAMRNRCIMKRLNLLW